MVNTDGDAIMGFSGSHSNQYAAAYYTGRSASDSPGEMSPPVLLKEGEATYNLIDGYGRNRWGDYSLCSLDPVKQTLWTVQEYAHSHNESGTNRWGTWIGELAFNQPPETPNNPDGPEVWAQFIDTTFTSTTTDPEEESIYYLFDWGDGNNSGWIGPYGSGQTGEAAHNWTELGEFEVKVKAKDDYDVQSDWSEPATITIVENQSPEKPIITGPKTGAPRVLLTYKFVAEDPEGNDIFYMVSWGDGHYMPYTGPYASGEEVTFSHSWSKEGDYTINAKAKDEYGSKSLQSSFRLSITKTRAVYTPFQWFLQQHPHLFPIIRLLLQR
jgi:hypothetical protein